MCSSNFIYAVDALDSGYQNFYRGILKFRLCIDKDAELYTKLEKVFLV